MEASQPPKEDSPQVKALVQCVAPGALPRSAIFLSGSGSNAAQILERWQQSGAAAPFRPVVLVTDAPDTSRARELGQRFALPVVDHDIRAFYRERGEARVSLASENGRRLRDEWTGCLRGLLAPYRVDFGLLAGFVPLTNIVGDFPCLNVHPGDLTYRRDGQRFLVGLHAVPVERAILAGLTSVRSSVILARPYTGADDMDTGPLLGISAPVPLDLQGNSLAALRAAAAARPPVRPRGGYADRLEQVAGANLQRLKEGGDWVVFPQVVFDVASGRFALDSRHQVFYRVGGRWHPVETVVYGRGDREIVFCPGPV